MKKYLLTKFVYLFICLFVYLYIQPPQVFATGEFKADYDVQYAISPTGKTIVTQHVTLENRLPNFYPEEYTLLLDSDKITNIIAYDDKGVITPKISVKDSKTHISLTFNVKAIGLGKSLTFSLRYEHSGVVNQAGNIWEIYVPGVLNDPDIGLYDVTLAVPPTFGPAAYLSPKPSKGNTWTKEQMIEGGITGAYGTSQKFSVALSYLLTNNNSKNQIQQIALPPDTAYQEVILTNLDPKPQTVIRDSDGNWIATYEMDPKEKLNVQAALTISTFLDPRAEFITPEINSAEYVKAADFWEVTDPKISSLARTLQTPREIYSYVAEVLSYDYEKINAQAVRLGALGALQSPKKAVCMEFTDLFIAIARAAGIPARRVVGYAYTNNPKLRPLSLVSDVLHAWPEYYDSETKRWIPIDPTWANTTGGVDYFTKLDFNHIVFAINGKDSSLPYPAGYYRDPQTTGRDVSVEFSKSTLESKGAQLTTSIEFPESIGGGMTAQGKILIINKGGESAYNIPVSLLSEPGNIRIVETIPELLPFAVKEIPFTGTFNYTAISIPGKITAQVNNTLITRSFTIKPLFWLIAAGVLIVLIIIFLIWKIFRKH